MSMNLYVYVGPYAKLTIPEGASRSQIIDAVDESILADALGENGVDCDFVALIPNDINREVVGRRVEFFKYEMPPETDIGSASNMSMETSKFAEYALSETMRIQDMIPGVQVSYRWGVLCGWF